MYETIKIWAVAMLLAMLSIGLVETVFAGDVIYNGVEMDFNQFQQQQQMEYQMQQQQWEINRLNTEMQNMQYQQQNPIINYPMVNPNNCLYGPCN